MNRWIIYTCLVIFGITIAGCKQKTQPESVDNTKQEKAEKTSQQDSPKPKHEQAQVPSARAAEPSADMPATLVLSGYARTHGDDKNKAVVQLNKEEIVNIANNAFLSKGFSLSDYTIHYDDDNKDWADILTEIKERRPAFKERYEEYLTGKNYQVIQYHKEPFQMSGMFLVFVDRESGAILDFWGGV